MAQLRFASVVLDGVLGPLHLAWRTWQCPGISVVQEAIYEESLKTLGGQSVSSNSPSRVWDLDELMGWKSVSLTRGHWHGKENQWSGSQIAIACALSRWGGIKFEGRFREARTDIWFGASDELWYRANLSITKNTSLFLRSSRVNEVDFLSVSKWAIFWEAAASETVISPGLESGSVIWKKGRGLLKAKLAKKIMPVLGQSH